MKKTIFTIIALCFLIIISCKKTSTSGAGGSWTINNITYPAVSCIGNYVGTPGTLSAFNISLPNTTGAVASDVICSFQNTLPTASGTYTVINGNNNITSSNQIVFTSTIGGVNGTTYLSTGGETVTVTVSGGKVSVSGSGISMYNQTSTTTLSLNITQLQ
jgi:hypothetical protein